MTTTLKAEKDAYGWYVIDTNGGRWTPDDDTQREIAEADDPAETAVRIAESQPMRGRWAD